MVLTIVYYVQFRNYHASLEKLDKLTTLFHNPNARVASGEQGKRILKKLGVTTEKEVKEDKKTKLEDTLQQVSELLKASQEPKKVESVNDYKPPEIVEETNTVSSYQLIDAPQVHQPLLRAPSHQSYGYVYPGQFQVSAPVLPPQVVATAPQTQYYPTVPQ